MGARLETTYRLTFGDGRTREFTISVDAATLVQPVLPGETAEWTELGFEQCRGCKLNAKDSPRCPVAVSLGPVIRTVDGAASHEMVDVTVTAGGRQISKRTSLQEALKSLFGLLMVTSGCPAFEKLRPMARFHLPFATPEETAYRVAGMHMLAQYYRSKQGLPLDLDFTTLNEMYAEIHQVNVDLAKRMRRAAESDAHLNGVVDLDCLTMLVPMVVKRDLPTLRPLFTPYLKKD